MGQDSSRDWPTRSFQNVTLYTTSPTKAFQKTPKPPQTPRRLVKILRQQIQIISRPNVLGLELKIITPLQ